MHSDSNDDIDGSHATSNKSGTPSEASSSPVNTPGIRPSPVDNGHGGAGVPLFDALSATSVSPNTAPSLTTEWAKTVMAGSPSHLVHLTSESPPTQPSSYEDAARMHNTWAARRPLISPSPTSGSPPAGSRRPLSFQSETQHRMTGTPSMDTGAVRRRSSLNPHSSAFQQAANLHYPPLPHQPQRNFYDVHDIDVAMTPQSGMKAGDQGYFFGFDRLPSDNGPSAKAEKVILAGYQGGLQVYAVSSRGIKLVSSLKGLRGGVHYAKVLPWTMNTQSSANVPSFPLVAVVVHGPVLPSPSTDVGGGDDLHDAASPGALRPDSSASSRPSYAHPEPYSTRAAPPIQSYQTSVEIYSLKTNKLVDVLLQAPKMPINTEVSLLSPLFQPPSPSGALSVKADAGTVAVCSGLTGECWIYRQLVEPQNSHMFACVGKVWTTLQQSYRAEVAEETDKISTSSSSARVSSHHRSTPPMPIFALNGRWIAYCPPNLSSQAALRAHVSVPTQGRAPGVSSMAPPHLPTPSVAVDLPISDSMVNKLMRETTQELISGMKWVGQQGLQAWNSYWSQGSLTSPTHQQQQQQARSPPSHWTSASSRNLSGDSSSQFPPTHGTTGSFASGAPRDPAGLVSIIDVELLPLSTTIHPLATFSTPLGCSFVSFSPSSLALFTASSKGDVQTVWDLLRLQHTSSSPLQTTLAQYETIGPQVRQIAQFSRMTVARIVEVAWSEPHGDRLAMVTERGTIHLLDMPYSSFMWPPPRRRKVAKKSTTNVDAAEQPTSAVSIASGALGAAYQAAKPFVARSRRGSANNNNTMSLSPSSGTTLRDSAAQGGRVIAASISHSLGKTGTALSQLRHTGENRVSLPPSIIVPSVGCVSWSRERKAQSLFSLGDGTLRVFSCSTRVSTSSTSVPRKKISRANAYKDFRVPFLPDDAVAPMIRQIMELGAADEYLELSDADMEAENTLTLRRPGEGTGGAVHYVLGATIPQAEIESSAPYQPFHTDRRVSLWKYGGLGSAGVVVRGRSQDEAVDASLPTTTAMEKKKRMKTTTTTSTTTKKKKKFPGAEYGSTLEGEGEREREREREGEGETASPVSECAWAFGQPIPSVKLDVGVSSSSSAAAAEEDSVGPDDHIALPQSAMERVMQYGDAEQIVVTTRRRRGGGRQSGGGDEDGFFEDDCEVLDFADQRV
ncbi:hypothetical protein E4U19_002526 [Claviceps sp. Clav32 group G5]|nr:hypothetical protein E4U19_002526 [Claviceps sp. Clav32 group G5]KAG6045570.1 hypothetical protein E4U39_002176 [Claviceps sp. Clav50 group G5]